MSPSEMITLADWVLREAVAQATSGLYPHQEETRRDLMEARNEASERLAFLKGSLDGVQAFAPAQAFRAAHLEELAAARQSPDQTRSGDLRDELTFEKARGIFLPAGSVILPSAAPVVSPAQPPAPSAAPSHLSSAHFKPKPARRKPQSETAR